MINNMLCVFCITYNIYCINYNSVARVQVKKFFSDCFGRKKLCLITKEIQYTF